MKIARTLGECATEGLRILNSHFQQYPTEPFSPAPFLPVVDDLSSRFEGCLDVLAPDPFYAYLSVLHATDDASLMESLVGHADAAVGLEQSLGFIENALYQGSRFDFDLVQSVHKHTTFSDDRIREAFNARFDVQSIGMMDMPTDRSVYFTKVNHGYWEYMRTAYDELCAERNNAALNVKNIGFKQRRLRTSGVTQFWGRQIRSHYMSGQDDDKSNRESVFCISLVAGTEPPARSLNRKLTTVTRGAAIGLMSMFEAALPELARCRVGDGGASRALIFDRKLDSFVDKYVADSEACLFVVPPHLKQIDFVDYKGSVYKFLVPPTKINETWKTVAASLLGYLVRLGERHRTITVLGQGATIFSLMTLLFSDVDALPQVRLRFFDLGRVLDVATPEFLQEQAWAQHGLDTYIAEGKKVFRMSKTDDFLLASPI